MPDSKLSIRPVIQHINDIANKNEAERFQNITIRPIIKLQHNLLIAFFEHHNKKRKINYTELKPQKKKELINKTFKSDTRFKLEIRSLIIGHFTASEFMVYQEMASELNRRILTIIEERLLSVV